MGCWNMTAGMCAVSSKSLMTVWHLPFVLLIYCQQNKFWHVEIKAYSPFWGPLLYNWNVSSACSFLSLDTLLCFFLCFLCYFLPFLPPCYLFHTANQYGSTLTRHFPVSSLFWCFSFTPEPVSVWVYLSMVKSTPSTSSYSVLTTRGIA